MKVDKSDKAKQDKVEENKKPSIEQTPEDKFPWHRESKSKEVFCYLYNYCYRKVEVK